MNEHETQTNHVLEAQRRLFARISIAGVAVIVLCMLYGYRNIQQDDSYILYSYAKNLAEGHGYVFNVGERINATTSPLYTLLLFLLYEGFRFIPSVTIPLIGHVIGAVSLFALCLFLMRSFRTMAGSPFAFLLPLIFLVNPMLASAFGMETFLAMALAMGCLAFYADGRLKAASLMCSSAVLARPDMLLLAAVLVAYDVIRHRRLPTLGVIGAFLLPIAAWLVFSAFYFGSLIPSSVAAKLVQTEAGLWGEGPVFLKGLFSGAILCSAVSGYRQVVPIVIMLLAAVVFVAAAGLVVTLVKHRLWPIFRHPVFHLILLWNFVYLVAYGVVLDAPAYAWYYTPLTLGLALFMTLPLEGLDHQLSQAQVARPRIILAGLLLSLVLVATILPLAVSRIPVTPRHETHKRAAEWLNAHAPDGSSVGANDIGVLRFYYEKGAIVDGVGLVTPEVVDHLRRGDYSWYIHNFQPDYLMFIHPTRSRVEGMVQEGWFQKEYVVDTIIGGSEDGVAIWRRQHI
jgi:hypothetical protein